MEPMEPMEDTPPLAPQRQLFLDLVREVPGADLACIDNYAAFTRVAREVFANQQAFWSRYALSEGRFGVLQLLRQAPQARLTPSALAQAAGVTRGTMTGLLAGLERSGLVMRTQHPEDGRMVHIELTAQALELLERALPERIGRITRFMSALTADEQRELRALLEKVERSLPALCDT
jgi:DNA-binding MarR family transcriptional regulator